MIVIAIIVALLANGEPVFKASVAPDMGTCLAAVPRLIASELENKIVRDAKGYCVALDPARGSV